MTKPRRPVPGHIPPVTGPPREPISACRPGIRGRCGLPDCPRCGLLAIACPGQTCRAQPGQPCVTSTGEVRAEPHKLRWLAMQDEVVKCECDRRGCPRCQWTTFRPTRP